MRLRIVVIAVIVSAGSFACGSTSKSGVEGSQDNSESSAIRAVYSIMLERSDLGSDGPGPRTILQALPGSQLSQQMGRSFSDVVVTGTVSAVKEGQAYRVADPPGATDSPVPWDSGDFDVLSLYVTFDVDQDVCSSEPVPTSVTFRFFVSSKDKIETVRDGLEKMGEIAVFLKSSADPQDPVFYQADSDGLLSEVDADGHIPWPVAEGHYGETWTRGGETVASLRQSCPA
jgi:hypothetical protein